jgi:hypothetical protein
MVAEGMTLLFDAASLLVYTIRETPIMCASTSVLRTREPGVPLCKQGAPIAGIIHEFLNENAKATAMTRV